MAEKKRTAICHVVKPKDVIENIGNVFSEVTEAGIDLDNHTIQGVCLFGTRNSANDRIYSTKAIATLTALAEGAKCYADHPSVDEMKQKSGVRSIRDWIGAFEGARQNGDKIYANLRCREAYFDLMRDIATIQPHGMGMSVNCRVKVFSDSKGRENVVDIDKVRSFDCVSEGATISNLWEGLGQKVEQNANPEIEILKDLVEDKVEALFAEEGMIQDKLDNDKIRREISDITYIANGLIEKTLYDEKMSVTDKRKKVMAVFDDLDKEVKKKLSAIKESITEEENMDKDQIEQIKNQAVEEYKKSEEAKKAGADLTEAKAEIKKLEDNLEETTKTKDKEIEELKKERDELKSQNQDLKVKLDEKELSEKIAEKKTMIAELTKDLPKEAITEVFTESLMALQEKKEDDKVITVEEQAKQLVEDRKALLASDSGKVKGSGDHYNPDKETTESKQKVTDEDIDDFVDKKLGK